MSGPLSGVRVVDLTTMISGPIATRMLADQGADVLKIEAPGLGDLTRHLGSRRRGVSAVFATSNRNKRSVVLDLKHTRGRELLDRLLADADVFVQNFRPGTAERMGIGEAALRRVRPDLVYVSISGFGETGPYAHKRVYDPVIQALSGLASIQKDRDTGRPRMVRTIVPDKLTAVTAAQAITAALFARERTGRGTHVRLAMLDATVAFLWPWRGLVKVLERPEWLEDPRFKTAGGRVSNAGERLELTQQVLRTRPSAEWLERLDAEGVPCAPVLAISEIPEHPQVVENELIVESEHPIAGPMRQPRSAALFDEGLGDGAEGELAPAPTLGEHTDEVLAELGLEAGEIRALRESGAVA
jgi:crotonobetainyl-CoA:carnitine CoA-transferase CaiB-like acyl-CoA transferase